MSYPDDATHVDLALEKIGSGEMCKKTPCPRTLYTEDPALTEAWIAEQELVFASVSARSICHFVLFPLYLAPQGSVTSCEDSQHALLWSKT